LRTIFTGDKGGGLGGHGYREYDSGGWALYPGYLPVAGELNVAPIGLGNLVLGYAPDARIMYCPSTGGAMRDDLSSQGWDGSHFAWDIHSAKSLQDLQRIGGLDADSIMHGDYTWFDKVPNSGLPLCYDSQFGRERTVSSDYAYRNTPCNTGGVDWISGPWPDLPTSEFEVVVGYTKPGVKTSSGSPMFKTQKFLGSRALVADAFGRTSNQWLSASQEAKWPGSGIYAHRDGYNVLYGDWSAGWYGDPQQRLIWWPKPYYEWGKIGNSTVHYGINTIGTDKSTLYSYEPAPGTWLAAHDYGHGNRGKDGVSSDDPLYFETYDYQTAWHIFDAAHGVDRQ